MRRVFFWAAWAGVAAIVVLSLVPGYERPHSGLSGHEEHFMAYTATSLVFALSFRDARTRLVALGGLCLLSIVLELGQHFSPGRHPAIADALVSSLGAAAGMATGTMALLLLRRAG